MKEPFWTGVATGSRPAATSYDGTTWGRLGTSVRDGDSNKTRALITSLRSKPDSSTASDRCESPEPELVRVHVKEGP